MQCYTFMHGSLEKGIQTIERDERVVVFGGEEGPGRRPFSVRLHHQTDKFSPPDIANGLILKAYPRRVNTKSNKTYVVLAKPTYGYRSKKYVVRIYTGSSVGGSLGSWTILDKTTETRKEEKVEYPLQLVVGWGGSGQYARVSRWYDGIFVMAPGNSIFIRCEDGMEKVIVNVDGRLDLLTSTEHMMLAASQQHAAPEETSVITTPPEEISGVDVEKEVVESPEDDTTDDTPEDSEEKAADEGQEEEQGASFLVEDNHLTDFEEEERLRQDHEVV